METALVSGGQAWVMTVQVPSLVQAIRLAHLDPNAKYVVFGVRQKSTQVSWMRQNARVKRFAISVKDALEGYVKNTTMALRLVFARMENKENVRIAILATNREIANSLKEKQRAKNVVTYVLHVPMVQTDFLFRFVKEIACPMILMSIPVNGPSVPRKSQTNATLVSV